MKKPNFSNFSPKNANFSSFDYKSSSRYTLNAAFLRKFVALEQRQWIEAMIEALIESLERKILETKWIGNQTKNVIRSKLQNLSYILGGPEEMYYTKQFDDYNGFGNVIKKHLNPSINKYYLVKVTTYSSDIIELSINLYKIKRRNIFKEDRNTIKDDFYQMVTSTNVQYFPKFNLICMYIMV